MILDTTLKTIEIVLAGAKTTNDCEYTVDYADTNSGTTFVPAGSMGVTNGTSAVTAVPAPTGVQRHVKALTVYNADTVSSTVTVRMYDGTNRRILIKTILASGQSLVWTADVGWSVPGFSGVAQEVGTWTPADNSGAGLSLTISAATYIKMGRQVTIAARIAYPSTASSANNSLSGLPFKTQNSAARGSGAVIANVTGGLMALTDLNATTFAYYKTGTLSTALNSDLSSTSQLFSLTYFTD